MKLAELGVSNADVAATASADYSNPGHGRGSLDLTADFERAQVSRIVRYLPTSISEKLRMYLGHGLQAGMSRGAKIEVHGDLTKFPYSRDPEAGIFHIVAPFKGGKFDPSPYPPRNMRNGTPNVWPAFDGIDGVFEIRQNVLRFDIDRARYKRVALHGVNGRIDDLGTRESNLVIKGDGLGPLADMLDYVNESSLGIMARHQTEKIRAEGPASLALKLSGAAHAEAAYRRGRRAQVSAEQSFERGERAAAVAIEMKGKVRFTERSAQTERLTAQFLGGDVRASGGLKQDGTYALDMNGRLAVEAARGARSAWPGRTGPHAHERQRAVCAHGARRQRQAAATDRELRPDRPRARLPRAVQQAGRHADAAARQCRSVDARRRKRTRGAELDFGYRRAYLLHYDPKSPRRRWCAAPSA